MSTVEREAEQLLAPLREVETAGPGSVDVGGAVRRGRSVQRGRIAGSALGIVLAIVAGVVVVPALVQRAAPPATGRGEFSPLRQEFSAGPAAGFTPSSYTTGRYRQVAEYASGDHYAYVVFYAAGEQPEPGWTPRGTQTAPVFSAQPPAVDLADPVVQPGHTELAWQWQPGAWAIVDVPPQVPDAKTVARKIAQNTGSGYRLRVRTPFSIAAPPHGYHVIGVRSHFVAAPALPSFELLLGTSDAWGRDPLQPAANSIVSVGPYLRGPHSRPLGAGFDVAAVGEDDDEVQQIVDSAQLSAGRPVTDPDHWTTKVIR